MKNILRIYGVHTRVALDIAREWRRVIEKAGRYSRDSVKPDLNPELAPGMIHMPHFSHNYGPNRVYPMIPSNPYPDLTSLNGVSRNLDQIPQNIDNRHPNIPPNYPVMHQHNQRYPIKKKLKQSLREFHLI